MTRLTWIKTEAGEYRSECGDWSISKTHSRSGWRVHSKATKFHGYAPTLKQAKDMAEYNRPKPIGKPLIEIL